MAVFVVLGGAHKELGENIDLEINPGVWSRHWYNPDFDS